MDSSAKKAVLYTDGACLGNPGKGGYAFILDYQEIKEERAIGVAWTTNNRMELWAVIAGLEKLPSQGWQVTVFTDSRYVADAVEKKWLHRWVQTRFKRKKNSDLWYRFWRLAQDHQVQICWVKGHAGHLFNERCDQLAVRMAKQGPWQKDQGYQPSPLLL